MERPDWSTVRSMFNDVERAAKNMRGYREKMAEVTGTAWSDDRMIKVVVGPRGQLVDLDIDPRVFRTPNSKALSAAILNTTRRAVEDAMRRHKEIMDEMLTPDLRGLIDGDPYGTKMMDTHDSELGGE